MITLQTNNLEIYKSYRNQIIPPRQISELKRINALCYFDWRNCSLDRLGNTLTWPHRRRWLGGDSVIRHTNILFAKITNLNPCAKKKCWGKKSCEMLTSTLLASFFKFFNCTCGGMVDFPGRRGLCPGIKASVSKRKEGEGGGEHAQNVLACQKSSF